MLKINEIKIGKKYTFDIKSNYAEYGRSLRYKCYYKYLDGIEFIIENIGNFEQIKLTFNSANIPAKNRRAWGDYSFSGTDITIWFAQINNLYPFKKVIHNYTFGEILDKLEKNKNGKM